MGSVWSNSDGLRVHFGTRKTGEEGNFGEAGAPSGTYKEIAVVINESDFTLGAATYNGTSITIPSGFTIKAVVAEVVTAFTAMTGTSPTLVVGITETNRAALLSNAQCQATGPLDLSSTANGTLALSTPLAAASTLTVLLGGTSPVIAGRAGKIVVYVRYTDPNAA